MMLLLLPILRLAPLCLLLPDAEDYARRVELVRSTPGFVALWDFVLREPGGARRFVAHQPKGARNDFALDAVNYVRDYWNEGRAATYDDFPLQPDGPFGQAIRIRAETDATFRPLLMVPRARLHDSRLDIKGPGRSVSMVAWVLRESGNHAIAGIWHEGTDLKDHGSLARRVEAGRRQYALFAGLAANNGAAAVHVSENGASSFGDRYARNLAVTPQLIPADSWAAVGFVFDNRRNTVTAYLNGRAEDFWIENPARHPFFRWPAKGWEQRTYTPPETKVLRREVLETTAESRVELHTFEFTKVCVILRKDARGRFTEVVERELAALRVNPYWFDHDLYAPRTPEEGGPFTIGRVIHMGRSIGFTGLIGGVAVFDRALSPSHMRRLAQLGIK